MAFTESQKLDIVKITGVDAIRLDDVLDYYTANITAAVETKVIAEIERWDAGASTNFTAIEPNLRNFGARINPNSEREDIRRNIGNLLFLYEAGVMRGGSSLVRG